MGQVRNCEWCPGMEVETPSPSKIQLNLSKTVAETTKKAYNWYVFYIPDKRDLSNFLYKAVDMEWKWELPHFKGRSKCR